MSQPWMEGRYDAALLLASWAISVYALYMLHLVVRRMRANDRHTGLAWLLGGALCVGTGVWAEGLLGVMALQLPIQLGYVRSMVLAAWLPAVTVGAATIWLQHRRDVALPFRVLAGLMVSAVLCLLTYIDISSMVFQPQVEWDGRFIAAGMAVTVLACIAGALLIRRELDLPARHLRILGLSVGLATLLRLGQTLIVMAVNVPFDSMCISADQLGPDALLFMLLVPSVLLLALMHLGTVTDERSHRRHEALSHSLKAAQAALAEAGQQDGTTGLLNRQGFEAHLRGLLEGDCSQIRALSVYHLSLDGFKSHVDTFGHGMGDTVLRYLAGRLRGLVRDGDVLSRADTDEFMLMCQGMADEHMVAQLGQRLVDAISEPCLIQDHDITLSCSIGIASYPASTNADQLLSHARDAMLTARKAGGGVYCFYERGMDRSGAEQIDMQRDLRHAIARNELTLHFQPKLRAEDKSLAGVEALLRWTHPQRGSVSPAQFIPVAERFGLIGELGLWVLNEACRHIRIWHDAGLNVPVAINLSAHQLRQPDLELRVRDALKRHRVPARMLIMEITESAAMDDIDASLRVFDMLDDIGVRLSIDDFGTGYSSLSYLRRLPARQLKIDRSFVKDLSASLDAQAIVEAVVRLSHALGLKVVAEGVETQEQAQILTNLRCDELQGFLFAKPMPESALLAWLVQQETAVPASTQATVRAATEEEDWRCWAELETAGS